MSRSSKLYLILLSGFIICPKVFAQEVKLICQVHIKHMYNYEPDGEEDAKVLVHITEAKNKFVFSLDGPKLFISIWSGEKSNFTKNNDLNRWMFTSERMRESGTRVSNDVTIDRNSGYISFYQIDGKYEDNGTGVCEKVNIYSKKF